MSKCREHTHILSDYCPISGVFDELVDKPGHVHPELSHCTHFLQNLDEQSIGTNQRLANTAFRRNGITFTVYDNAEQTEKIFPFDLIPRIILQQQWQQLELGLKQRVQALNMFLTDIYSEQHIVKAKGIPEDLIKSSPAYLPIVNGIRPPGDVYVHVAGIDLVKDQNNDFLVLEDNLRSPSGVSYVLENRYVMKRLFPDMFKSIQVNAVDEYPRQLFSHLNQLSSQPGLTVVLTPGQYNSAYFEHSFLARTMGCELVKGQDLFVENEKVYLKTTIGPQLVSVIYRRIDDDFLDPKVFNPKSVLGVPGIMSAYQAGNVVLANAIGNGIADDKAIYPYVPEMIRFYLDEEPILKQVQTFNCDNVKHCEHVLKNLNKMVVKAVDASGGYDMLIGSQASKEQLNIFKEKIKQQPRKYIAQPIVELSTCPTFDGTRVSPRRVDLRPFIITSKQSWVLPGGLTRVALNEGSYVVNSSQGGGSKDTWIVGEQS